MTNNRVGMANYKGDGNGTKNNGTATFTTRLGQPRWRNTQMNLLSLGRHNESGYADYQDCRVGGRSRSLRHEIEVLRMEQKQGIIPSVYHS